MHILEGRKSIIIYFSRPGYNYTNDGLVNLPIGNTKVVAQKIQKYTGADIFEVKPLNAYPVDYMKTTKITREELKKDARPELKEYLENIDDYDVVFLGYPNWWGTMPMPMFTQLEKLNFKDKIILPFCTHEGDMMGNSLNDIDRICIGGKMKNVYSVQGSRVNFLTDEKIEAWLSSL